MATPLAIASFAAARDDKRARNESNDPVTSTTKFNLLRWKNHGDASSRLAACSPVLVLMSSINPGRTTCGRSNRARKVPIRKRDTSALRWVPTTFLFGGVLMLTGTSVDSVFSIAYKKGIKKWSRKVTMLVSAKLLIINGGQRRDRTSNTGLFRPLLIETKAVSGLPI